VQNLKSPYPLDRPVGHTVGAPLWRGPPGACCAVNSATFRRAAPRYGSRIARNQSQVRSGSAARGNEPHGCLGDGVLYLVRLSVPRLGGRREWEVIRDGFEDALASQRSPVVTGLRFDSEFRRGRDYVRVVMMATADAEDLADALGLVWQAFGEASSMDNGWDLAAASAEVTPVAP
jgi:hypothetical protein